MKDDVCCLITGASSGIGKEAALKLAEKGFHVTAVARRMDRLEALTDRFPNITPKAVDLSDPDAVEKFCKDLAGLLNPISVLVNNAGYGLRGTLEDIPMEDIRRVFEVNLFAHLRITQACLPAMRKARNGRIVNISSVLGKVNYPFLGIYGATKYAVEAISDSLRIEMRPYGIHVVVIRPGSTASELEQAGAKMSAGYMVKSNPDYQPLYAAIGSKLREQYAHMVQTQSAQIADLILEAVFSEAPKAVYTLGPGTEVIEKRKTMGDDEFDRYMSELNGLAGLRF